MGGTFGECPTTNNHPMELSFKQFSYCFLLFLLILRPPAALAQRQKLKSDVKEIVLENRYLSRKFALDQGWLRTSYFANLQTGENLLTSSPEFQIQFENGIALNSKDFVAEYYTPVLLANEVRRSLVTMTEKRQRLRVELEYTLGPNDFFMRKRLRVYPLQQNLPRIVSISVEALSVENPRSIRLSPEMPRASAREKTSGLNENASMGQPLYFNDSFFWGMEYPAGRNNYVDSLLSCTQDPGRLIPEKGFESYSVVAGISPRGEIQEWFLRYVDTFRLPSRSFMIANWRNDDRLKQSPMEGVKSVFELFHRRLLQPFGLKLDAVVLGGDGLRLDYSKVGPASARPGSAKSLRDYLESNGSGLGLVLPLNDILQEGESSREDGYERVPEASPGDTGKACFCLAGPRYQAALKEYVKELHRNSPPRFVRHNVEDLLCRAGDHGHPPGGPASLEAGTNALIEILRLERSLNPDLFISLGGNLSFSPWWLQYVNTMWWEPEVGYRRPDLSPQPRDWEINNLSIAFYTNFVRANFQFPDQCLMSGGLARDRNSDVGGFREPLGAWADGVAEYLGRGQDVVELNLRPQTLEEEAWHVLGRGLQWKASRQLIYQRGLVVGGDPEVGEPHGYFYNNGVQAVALLRNPSPTPKEVSFQLPAGLRGSLRMVQTYPRLRQEAEILKGRSIINTMMEGLEIRVLELMPEKSQDLALPLNVDFAPSSSFLDSSDAELKKVKIEVFPESPEIFFSRPQTIGTLQIEGQPVSLDPSGKADLQMNERVKQVVESRELLNSKKAEVGIYAKRGTQLTLPEWHDATSALIALILQPKEGEPPSPLYVTMNRKQLEWKTRQTLAPEFGSKVWKILTTPLEFQKQALLDWAVKDTQESTLYLWWLVQAPRPSLEITYTAPLGESKEFFSRLLTSPRSGQYVVNIPLEAENHDAPKGEK